MECLIPNVGKRGEFDWRKWKINIFAREKKKSCFPTQSMLLTFILLVIQIVSLLLLLLSLSLSLSLDSRSFNTIRRRSSSSPVQSFGSTLLWNVTQRQSFFSKVCEHTFEAKLIFILQRVGCIPEWVGFFWTPWQRHF